MTRIAIIDDDKVVVELFTNALKAAHRDWAVDGIQDLSSAQALLKRHKYDLVITDIDLGSPTQQNAGFEIVAGLKGRQIPVIVVTGLPHADLLRGPMLALDVWDYLQKPVDVKELLNLVSVALSWSKTTGAGAPTTGPTSHAVRDENLSIDLTTHPPVRWSNMAVRMPLTALRLLIALSSQADALVTYDELLALLVTGRNKQTLRVHIQAVRDAFRQVDPSFNRLLAVPYQGYMWKLNR